jgi:hypothetical protein
VKLHPDAAARAEDLRKEKALRRLEARYGEARELLSSAEPHRNLDWVLGASGAPVERRSNLSLKMIPLVSLWLEDLAVELESELAPDDPDERAQLASQACKAAARSLREATEGFLSSVGRCDGS